MVQLENTKTLRQGLSAGDVGVVVARAGVGKSAYLVQIALAELLEGKAVLHVSLESPVAHVRRWYDDQIARLPSKTPPANDEDSGLQIERLRHILCYLDGSFTPERLQSSLKFLAEHMDFDPRLVVIDGLAIPGQDEDLIERLASMSKESNIEVWLSSLKHRSSEVSAPAETELPPSLQKMAEWIAAFVCLEPEGAEVGIRRWLRSEGRWTRLPLRLDPRTLSVVGL